MTTSSSRRIRFQSGHTTIKNGKAIAAGLAFRPLAGTVKDTLAWWATVSEERRAKLRFIITPEIEAKALADWKARVEVRAVNRAGSGDRGADLRFEVTNCVLLPRLLLDGLVAMTEGEWASCEKRVHGNRDRLGGSDVRA